MHSNLLQLLGISTPENFSSILQFSLILINLVYRSTGVIKFSLELHLMFICLGLKFNLLMEICYEV